MAAHDSTVARYESQVHILKLVQDEAILKRVPPAYKRADLFSRKTYVGLWNATMRRHRSPILVRIIFLKMHFMRYLT